MKTLTAHQPNFLPWLPFFKKMAAADVFVILRHCQFEKNGFQNRFNLSGRWYTMSTAKGLDPIYNKEYVNPDKDWARIKAALPKLYGRQLDRFDSYISNNLYLTNTAIILHTAKLFNIRASIAFDFPTDCKGTDRLIELCKVHGCKRYLSGPSGRRYLDIEKFSAAGIEIDFFVTDKEDKCSLVEVLHGRYCLA